jgi:hypothetical protein
VGGRAVPAERGARPTVVGGGGGSRTRVRRSETERHSMLSSSLISGRRSKRNQTRRPYPELIFSSRSGDPCRMSPYLRRPFPARWARSGKDVTIT